MWIWSKLLPDKACSDVWVSTFRWKTLKPVLNHRRSFFPASELFLAHGFPFSSASRRTTPRARLKQKQSKSWQVYKEAAGRGKVKGGHV
ncbi:hypothetical protein PBY51_024648 [Eleginops maclovinus]|uniref:Uncharacterized protein n=1 Tax=Eleginops maclovinus TaxID=56733 RepID=A0AAN7Y034_ELEMC|nr:hypothetical protein PBY51_024648 [Eleginops maclovinus]